MKRIIGIILAFAIIAALFPALYMPAVDAANTLKTDVNITDIAPPISHTADVYNPGYYERQVDIIRYENESNVFTTNSDGEVIWYSEDPEIVKVNGYTQLSCNVSYLKPGNTKLVLSMSYNYYDWYLDKAYQGVTRVVLNVTVLPALPPNNTQLFAGGSGTEQDPYLISTKKHLDNITTNNAYLAAHYKLVNDLAFERADFEEGGEFYGGGFGWYPIGSPLFMTARYAFTGVFDGNGFVISGLKGAYNSYGQLATATVGLFGANLGTIKNLGVEDAEFQAFSQDRVRKYAAVGGIAGINAGVITNCYVKNSYIGGDVAGGIAGEMVYAGSPASITDCYTGNNKFYISPLLVPNAFHLHGGIVGNLDYGTVNRTYGYNLILDFQDNGVTYRPSDIGAVVGRLGGDASVTNAYYMSTIPIGIYNPYGDSDTVKLKPYEMTNILNFPAFSADTWYINPNDAYAYPQLSSFERIKRTLFVSAMPKTTAYAIGENLDVTGAQLTMFKPDGSFETFDIKEKNVVYSAPESFAERDTVYIEGFDSETAGTKILQVSYNDLVTNFEVYVVEEKPGDDDDDDDDDDDSVIIEDPVLEAEIRFWLGKPEGAITKEDALSINNLSLDSNDIQSLSGLEHFTNIGALRLNNNKISDLTPLSGLTELTTLRLNNNQISDLTPLSGLTKMELLQLNNNKISDLTPLAAMTELDVLTASDNSITDISPLGGLSMLRLINLKNNKIRDISALAGLTLLDEIVLIGNYLDTNPGSKTMEIIDELIARPVKYVDYLPQNTPPDDEEPPIVIDPEPSDPEPSDPEPSDPEPGDPEPEVSAVFDGAAWHIPPTDGGNVKLSLKGYHVVRVFFNDENGLQWESEKSDIIVPGGARPFRAIAKMKNEDSGAIRYVGIEKPVSVSAGTEFDGKTWTIPMDYDGVAEIEFEGKTIEYILASDYNGIAKTGDGKIAIVKGNADFDAVTKLIDSLGNVEYIGIDRK